MVPTPKSGTGDPIFGFWTPFWTPRRKGGGKKAPITWVFSRAKNTVFGPLFHVLDPFLDPFSRISTFCQLPLFGERPTEVQIPGTPNFGPRRGPRDRRSLVLRRMAQHDDPSDFPTWKVSGPIHQATVVMGTLILSASIADHASALA